MEFANLLSSLTGLTGKSFGNGNGASGTEMTTGAAEAAPAEGATEAR